VGDRFCVAGTDDLGVEGGQSVEGRGRLSAVSLEHTGHDLPVGPASHRVPREQDTWPGKVERDAAGRVAGYGQREGAAAEADLITVVQFAVDPHGRWRCRRQLAADLLKDGPFPVGQIRGRPRRPAAEERRVGVVRAHLDVAPGGDLGLPVRQRARVRRV
jgi:hypothetical protein